MCGHPGASKTPCQAVVTATEINCHPYENASGWRRYATGRKAKSVAAILVWFFEHPCYQRETSGGRFLWQEFKGLKQCNIIVENYMPAAISLAKI